MDGLKEIVDTLKDLLPKLEAMLPEGDDEEGPDDDLTDTEEEAGEDLPVPGKRPPVDAADEEEGDFTPDKKSLMVSMLRRSIGK